ncbi:MAG: hypothetical protein WC674_08860, partial [Candidatus Krumholzibacteriia bacterium]
LPQDANMKSIKKKSGFLDIATFLFPSMHCVIPALNVDCAGSARSAVFPTYPIFARDARRHFSKRDASYFFSRSRFRMLSTSGREPT